MRVKINNNVTWEDNGKIIEGCKADTYLEFYGDCSISYFNKTIRNLFIGFGNLVVDMDKRIIDHDEGSESDGH